jgi:glucose/arabinose dehydrogenase
MMLTNVALTALASAAGTKAEALYQANCASCHGAKLEGGSGSSLIDDVWKHGSSDEELTASIAKGHPTMGMPGFEKTLQPDQIRALIILMREKQENARSSAATPAKPLPDKPFATKKHTYQLETVAKGFDSPWGLAFLPDGKMLVTEKAGALQLVSANGKLEEVRGIPKVMNHGQGGLLAVAVHPDYTKNGWIYLGFADGTEDGGNVKATTAIVRGKIKDGEWVDQEWIYRSDKKFYTGSGVHFGTRIVFHSGYIYFIVGERGGNMEAQDLKRPNGKIFRLFEDGRVPTDNPFVATEGAEPGIWSYGHRNPQGMTLDPRDGSLYDTEHGPRGGDEFNRVVKGGNYGWPVVTYGMNYDGTPITAVTEKEGITAPVKHWTPSIAASGLMIYLDDKFPQWKGDFFAGSLKAQELHRLRLENGKVTEDEIVLQGVGRIRSVEQGPDGAIYLLLNQPDTLVRMVPAP